MAKWLLFALCLAGCMPSDRIQALEDQTVAVDAEIRQVEVALPHIELVRKQLLELQEQNRLWKKRSRFLSRPSKIGFSYLKIPARVMSSTARLTNSG